MLSGRGFDIVRRGRGLIAVAVLAGALGLPSSAAAQPPDFPWSGGGAAPGNWSDPANWVGGTAPSGQVGTLSFPALSGCASCYQSNNDVTGLSANAISIDEGVPYQISGNGLTLGAGGLSAAPSASDTSSATISLPITLGAPQTWSIAGAGASPRQLNVGTVTGSPNSLAVTFSSSGNLVLTSDVEVGAVTVTGSGTVALFGSLNGTDASPVILKSPANLLAAGAVAKSGALTSNGGNIQVGEGHPLDGTLAVKGAIALDSSTNLSMFIDQTGTIPSTDYSQVTATGAVNLGSASLFLDGSGAGCPALRVNDVYTLVRTTGLLSGTFGNAAEGTILTLNCSGTAPTVQIHYTAHTVTATVKTSAAGGTTTALAGPSTAVTNQTVMLTATVTAISGSPTGTVDFRSNGVLIPGCTGQTVTSSGPTTGTATCQTSFAVTSSPESLTATFTPASGPGGSTSSVANLVVGQGATATALAVSSATPGVGAPVTYTATVTPSPSGSAAQPSGTVTFYDDASGTPTPIPDCAGQGQVVGGSATCTLSYSSPGPHGITESYPGDANFTGSAATSPVTVNVVVSPPMAIGAPSISGDTTQGQTLSETHGTWTNSPTGFSYQWLDCDSAGTHCTPIPGATSQTYTLTASDVGHTIRVEEAAANSGGSGSPATSAATGVVQPPSAPPTAPVSTSPPVITGATTVGRTLSTSNGVWSGTPPSGYSYQWQRCTSTACTNAPNATGTIYNLSSADLGTKIRVVVLAVNDVGYGIAVSDRVGPVLGRAQIRAALAKGLTPKGKSAKLGAIVKARGYKLSFAAPESGSVVISWYQAGKPMLIGSGRATFGSPGTKLIKIRLTAAGKKLLRNANHLKVSAKAVLTTPGQSPITARGTFTLRR